MKNGPQQWHNWLLKHQVFVLKKKSLWQSALQTKTSVNFPQENSPPHEWQSQTVSQFTDGDYVLM